MSYLSMFDLKKYKDTREEKMRRENRNNRRKMKFISNQTMKMKLVILFFTHFLPLFFSFHSSPLQSSSNQTYYSRSLFWLKKKKKEENKFAGFTSNAFKIRY